MPANDMVTANVSGWKVRELGSFVMFGQGPTAASEQERRSEHVGRVPAHMCPNGENAMSDMSAMALVSTGGSGSTWSREVIVISWELIIVIPIIVISWELIIVISWELIIVMPMPMPMPIECI